MFPWLPLHPSNYRLQASYKREQHAVFHVGPLLFWDILTVICTYVLGSINRWDWWLVIGVLRLRQHINRWERSWSTVNDRYNGNDVPLVPLILTFISDVHMCECVVPLEQQMQTLKHIIINILFDWTCFVFLLFGRCHATAPVPCSGVRSCRFSPAKWTARSHDIDQRAIMITSSKSWTNRMH